MSWYDHPTAPWTYVSRKLITARMIAWWAFCAPLAVGGVIAALLTGIGPLLAVTAAALLAGAWGSWVIVRQVSAPAWAEGDEDLIVKRGRMFRSVTVVPYGRMQFVDVKAGPLDRMLGIAAVQLHTASPGTDASIAGVPAEEAARLRDRLTTRGEAKLAGL